MHIKDAGYTLLDLICIDSYVNVTLRNIMLSMAMVSYYDNV